MNSYAPFTVSATAIFGSVTLFLRARPDGLAHLYDAKRQTSFFVEMDRGNTEWAKKIDFYERARQHSDWQQQLDMNRYPGVLCAVPPRKVESVLKIVQVKQPVTRFLLKTWGTFLGREGVFAGWIDKQGKCVDLRARVTSVVDW